MYSLASTSPSSSASMSESAAIIATSPLPARRRLLLHRPDSDGRLLRAAQGRAAVAALQIGHELVDLVERLVGGVELAVRLAERLVAALIRPLDPGEELIRTG